MNFKHRDSRRAFPILVSEAYANALDVGTGWRQELENGQPTLILTKSAFLCWLSQRGVAISPSVTDNGRGMFAR